MTAAVIRLPRTTASIDEKIARYYREHKPEPVAPPSIPADLLVEIEAELLAAIREHRREVGRIKAAEKRESRRELVRVEKADYRRRHRAEIAAYDRRYKASLGYRAYLAREDVKAANRARAAAYEAAHKEQIAARKSARYWADRRAS